MSRLPRLVFLTRSLRGAPSALHSPTFSVLVRFPPQFVRLPSPSSTQHHLLTTTHVVQPFANRHHPRNPPSLKSCVASASHSHATSSMLSGLLVLNILARMSPAISSQASIFLGLGSRPSALRTSGETATTPLDVRIFSLYLDGHNHSYYDVSSCCTLPHSGPNNERFEGRRAIEDKGIAG